MVVIHIKKSEADGFLYETTCDTSNDTLIRELCDIWNLRLRLTQLAASIRDLAKYGPMKPHDKQGIDEIQEKAGEFAPIIEKGEFYLPDPQGIRTGNGVGPQLTSTFEMVASDAEALLQKDNVTKKIPMTREKLQEKLDNIRGAVIMAYPMGLPDWDTVKMTIDGIEGLDGTSAGNEALNGDTAELWVATKFFDRSQTVGDRLGRNEKTKVIAKMQQTGSGAPAREPGVSEAEKSAMMAYYFKKQEEQKALADAVDDDYLNSAWADSKSLQRSLRGQGNVRAPGLH